jgi:magnesium-transporting ATPase (P-type)
MVSKSSVPVKKQLNLENTMWMSTILTSQTPVYAVVIYTGLETRAKLNSRSAP